jgi:hypothetical protein
MMVWGSFILSYKNTQLLHWTGWHTPLILAAWEMETGEFGIEDQPGQN